MNITSLANSINLIFHRQIFIKQDGIIDSPELFSRILASDREWKLFLVCVRRASVLAGFNFSLLNFIQFIMSSRHAMIFASMLENS